jgi:hypothetical protein
MGMRAHFVLHLSQPSQHFQKETKKREFVLTLKLTYNVGEIKLIGGGGFNTAVWDW